MSTARGAAVGRRRPPVTPEDARRRRTVLLGGIAAVAAVAGGWWVVTGPPGRISSVSVSGYDRPDKALVARYVTAVATRGTVVDPPVGAIRRLSIRFPWIEDVHASRAFPKGLDVEIVQATPGVIVVPAQGPRMLVSTSGRVLGPAAGSGAAVPRVRVPGGAPQEGSRVSSPVVASALEFSSALHPATARRVLALHRSGGAIVGRLAGGPELRLGLPEDLPQKAHALELVLGQLSSEEERRATYIDLSVPSRPAVGNLVASTQTAPTAPATTPSTTAPTATAPTVPAPDPSTTQGTTTSPTTTTSPVPSSSTPATPTTATPTTPAPSTGGTATPPASSGTTPGATSGTLPGSSPAGGSVPPPGP